MKSARSYPMLATLIVGIFFLNACSPKRTPTTFATAPPQATVERKGATFIYSQKFGMLSPLYANNRFAWITIQLWNCWAWDFDENTNPHPVLVTEMPSLENGGISANGTVITMTLRNDTRWSDGQHITSDDFIFTYQMTVDPQNTVYSAYPYDQLAGLEAPDKRTVVMTFQEPFAPWQGTFWHGLLPAHLLRPIYERDGTLDNAEWNMTPKVGCGPYVFTDWESGSFAHFVANERYWLGKPHIDEIFIRFVPDDAAQIAALKAGDGDLGTFIAYPDVPYLQKAGFEMYTVVSGDNEGLYFYLDPEKGHPALQDVRVRRAIAMAFDRFSLVENLLLGMTKPAATDWDNLPYVDPTIEPWPYDPEQAMALLDEAGWIDTNGDGIRDKDSVDLILDYGTTTGELRQCTQVVFQQQMAEIGIGVNLFNYVPSIFFASYGEGGVCATGQVDIFQYATGVNFPDPDVAEWLCDQIPSDEAPEGINWMAICDEELDALFRLQSTQVDFEQRQQTFWKISRLIYENVYWLGYWNAPHIWAVGPRLRNVRLSGATPFFNIMEWDLSE